MISVLNDRGDVGKKHAENSGFLQVAEKNGIIIVFPQAKKTKENPYTCWDIYGYTGPNYGIVISTVN
jgi:poly(3-hydroxybutyrate) depolymerase